MLKESVMTLPEGVELSAPAGAGEAPWREAMRRVKARLWDGQTIGLAVTAFLLARVSIIGELSPFGLAFFAAVAAVRPHRSLAVGAGAMLGILTMGRPLDVAVYALSMALYWWFSRRARQERPPYYALPLVMAGVVLVSGIAAVLVLEKSLYGLVLVIFQALSSLILTFIFLYGLSGMHSGHSAGLSREACIALLAMAVTAVAGLHDWRVGPYALTGIATGLVVMALAGAGGAGLGTAAGAALGAAGGLTGAAMPLAIGTYAFGGLTAGVGQALGKPGVALGYLLGITIITAGYADGAGLAVTAAEAALAGGCLLFLPRRYLRALAKLLPAAREQAPSPQADMAIAATADKVREYASLFHDLAACVDTAPPAAGETRDATLTRQLAALTGKVCQSCTRHAACWEQNFYQSYHRLEAMVAAAALGGGTLPAVAAEKLQQYCIHPREMATCIGVAVEAQRTSSLYARQAANSQLVAAVQMQSLARLLAEMEHSLRLAGQSDRDKERYIASQAARAGCRLTSVRVRAVRGRPRVDIAVEPCRGSRACAQTILPLVSEALGERLELAATCGHNGKREPCRLCLTAAPCWDVTAGVAQRTKPGSSVCGDVVSLLELPHGQTAVVLSDGMGSGGQAAQESTAAVNMLSRCLTAGLSLAAAVKAVNALLQTGKENFAAVDLVIVDRFDGTAEFLKIGAPPSFIKRVREVGVVDAPHVPLGILPQVEARSCTCHLQNGDVLVLVSDGLLVPSHHGTPRQGGVVNTLRRLGDLPPQQMAEKLLAQAAAETLAPDDMTVVVLQVKQQAS